MRIDAQVGFVDRSRFDYPWQPAAAQHMQRDFTPADLWRILARNKYDGAVVAPMSRDPAEVDWLLELSHEHSWMTGVVGLTVEPRWLADPHFVGVRYAASEVSGEALVEAAMSGLTTDIAVGADEVRPLVNLLGPELRGLIAIVPDAGPHWDPAPWEQLARNESIFVKVCGLINDAGPDGWKADTYRPFVQRMLEWCGPRRLMYGSDWPRCMHTGTWKESLAAFTQALGAQTMETRSRILGENAAGFYVRRNATGGR